MVCTSDLNSIKSVDLATAGENKRILDLLFSYMPKITAERNMDRLLVLMAELGSSMVNADRCSLWLIDEGGKELWTKVAQGVEDGLRIPMDKGFVGWTLANGKSRLVEDAYKESDFDPSSDQKTGYRTKSVMTVPLMDCNGKVMGVYQAINKKVKNAGDTPVFSDEELEHLKLTATYSAKVVESVRLNAELEESQEDLVKLLGEVSESRSKETGEHIKRVTEISYKLALYFNVPESEAKFIRLASAMHDLGKVHIPDKVLNKPGRFDDDEFAIMKSHAAEGEKLLLTSKQRLLRFAAEIAGSHHERWDGKGYPRGLKGEEIPLSARICSVADVLDALASPRCYKPAWSEEKVRDEFVRQRGLQFQPELVDVLVEHWDDLFECYRKARSEMEATATL